MSTYMIFTGITGGHVLRSTDSTVTTTSVGSAGQLYLHELIPVVFDGAFFFSSLFYPSVILIFVSKVMFFVLQLEVVLVVELVHQRRTHRMNLMDILYLLIMDSVHIVVASCHS